MCVTGCVSKEKKRQDRKRIEEGREFSPSLFRSTKSKRVKRSKMIEKKTLFKPFFFFFETNSMCYFKSKMPEGYIVSNEGHTPHTLLSQKDLT